jgi:alpha-ribazole phosphatase
MAIFLIRHTTPLSPEGVCYGQTDLPVGPTFEAEAEKIRMNCPDNIQAVYSSSLDRCLRLVRYLWPDKQIGVSDALREMDFGAWENKPWAQIERQSLENWMKDFVHVSAPGGESYLTLKERCSAWWDQTIVRKPYGTTGGNGDAIVRNDDATGKDAPHTVIITHAGVIRSLLCHNTGAPLSDSFQSFPVPFGAVYRLYKEKDNWESRLL